VRVGEFSGWPVRHPLEPVGPAGATGGGSGAESSNGGGAGAADAPKLVELTPSPPLGWRSDLHFQAAMAALQAQGRSLSGYVARRRGELAAEMQQLAYAEAESEAYGEAQQLQQGQGQLDAYGADLSAANDAASAGAAAAYYAGVAGGDGNLPQEQGQEHASSAGEETGAGTDASDAGSSDTGAWSSDAEAQDATLSASDAAGSDAEGAEVAGEHGQRGPPIAAAALEAEDEGAEEADESQADTAYALTREEAAASASKRPVPLMEPGARRGGARARGAADGTRIARGVPSGSAAASLSSPADEAALAPEEEAEAAIDGQADVTETGDISRFDGAVSGGGLGAAGAVPRGSIAAEAAAPDSQAPLPFVFNAAGLADGSDVLAMELFAVDPLQLGGAPAAAPGSGALAGGASRSAGAFATAATGPSGRQAGRLHPVPDRAGSRSRDAEVSAEGEGAAAGSGGEEEEEAVDIDYSSQALGLGATFSAGLTVGARGSSGASRFAGSGSRFSSASGSSASEDEGDALSRLRTLNLRRQAAAEHGRRISTPQLAPIWQRSGAAGAGSVMVHGAGSRGVAPVAPATSTLKQQQQARQPAQQRMPRARFSTIAGSPLGMHVAPVRFCAPTAPLR
jgi:hypothetical protein